MTAVVITFTGPRRSGRTTLSAFMRAALQNAGVRFAPDDTGSDNIVVPTADFVAATRFAPGRMGAAGQASLASMRTAFEAGYAAAERGESLSAAWDRIMGVERVMVHGGHIPRGLRVEPGDRELVEAIAHPVPAGWTPKRFPQPHLSHLERYERGDWMVEENRRTSSMDRPFYVSHRAPGGHFTSARSQGFGRYATATAAMAAVDKKDPVK